MKKRLIKHRRTGWVFMIAAGMSAGSPLPALAEADRILFNRDVRPILANNCWSCHGPDKNMRKAKLRLDLREAATKEVIVPGKAGQSPLIQRIFSNDPEEVMPPAEHRKKLTTTQKKTLRDWINQGAKWQDHWAWISPRKEKGLPEGKNAIDYLIKRRLEARGLGFSAEAGANTLIRRLSLDLRGLPPTPGEVSEFLNDQAPGKVEKLVDRLLDSPAFGERMAVYWLDLVRYADTNGYHADIEWSVSPYRDYVIDAFNTNMPFDRFTREQIAGDLIPSATTAQKVAAGFNRLNMKSTEFGIQDKEYLAKYAADRVRTTATAWLGVTLGCAECHDHKFDPFTIHDFYSFAAFFADIKGVGYYPDAQKKGWGETIQATSMQNAQRILELEETLKGTQSVSLLADSRETGQAWSYTFKEPGQGWQRKDFDDASWEIGQGGFGSRGTPHSIVRTEWKSPDIWMRKVFSIGKVPEQATLHIQHDEEATVYINGQKAAHLTGFSTASADYTARKLDTALLKKGDNLIAIRCHQTGGGQFIDAGIRPGNFQKEKIEQEIANLRKTARSMLATVSVQPRTMRILPRGDWMNDSGQIVKPSAPGFLGGTEVAGRMELAEWITARNNPLTARVFVNRLWKLFFGTGLSRVLDDIGSQGEWPSHPDLLDWLAVEFMESGWNVKHMVKLMVTSRAYVQSSLQNEQLREIDPKNRLLARQSRFRLDAEFIRDNALSASGLLVRQVGGPSVKPYQPSGYWENLNFPRRSYSADRGSSQYRRGLYTHWQRQFLHPSLLAFDAPSREECTADRPRSNTPLGALVLLNDPTHVEAARALAQNALENKELTDNRARISSMIMHVLCRPARDEEITVLISLLEKHREEFANDPESANRLAAIGQHPVTKDTNRQQLAAWISVARALLNLHETITRN
ncbi:MAG: PSD1 and planctomycete cytochrome C domain-containing protein [Verrucomicrobiota bacterium]|nr:PSD1 and planctomycete cytochrome C domain-containing protein [Verrucomicrobiota bacterium]